MTETWRLLHHWGGDPGFHMAADEALLVSTDPRPALRFYTWEPEALSLGYFQRIADVPAARIAPAVVRRMTGGGAIHHANELTFSIAAPLDHPLYRGTLRESYAHVHAVLSGVLAELGIAAELRASRALRSDRADTGMCFHHSTPLDLAWDERKGVGSAQRRRAGRVLHHGSIKLRTAALEPGVATVATAAPDLGHEELARRIAIAFARTFAIELVPGELDDAEREHADARRAWFGAPEFVHRR